MNKILVTPRSLTTGGHPALDRLTAKGHQVVFSAAGKQPSENDLVALVPGCVGYLAGVEPVTHRVIDAATDLQVISRNGTGVDNIDLEFAKNRGIAICRAEGANAEGVAELAIGLLLAIARSISTSDRSIKGGAWRRHKGLELRDKTLGVVGYGKIGRRVAEMASGLGMNIVACDVLVERPLTVSDRFRFAVFDEVLASSDALSLHCPPLPNGRRLINASTITQMRHGALLVNTARYDLLDPDAVAAALDDGQLAGLAIDVFDREPPVDNLLAGHQRVIATPHVGGFTEESVDRAVSVAVDNLLNHLQSSPVTG
jgi:D-3-phosphoglycerate dehydrogenase / 2-oxoglutarate reductase